MFKIPAPLLVVTCKSQQPYGQPHFPGVQYNKIMFETRLEIPINMIRSSKAVSTLKKENCEEGKTTYRQKDTTRQCYAVTPTFS